LLCFAIHRLRSGCTSVGTGPVLRFAGVDQRKAVLTRPFEVTGFRMVDSICGLAGTPRSSGWIERETKMVTGILAALGAIVLVLQAATRLPAGVALFLRALIPVVRALRALRDEWRRNR
jgi:hypothetical protein